MSETDVPIADPEPSELAQSDLEELAEADPTPSQVSYSGSDFDVEGLVRRFQRQDIVVPSFGHNDSTIEAAGFQRRFVWRRSQMDKFIESLLLGYPIPGIFLVQQIDKRYLVLDGQQRLRTLAAFYEGIHGSREFSLKDVGSKFVGLTYKTLNTEQKRTLDNTFIQATIVKTDGSPESLDSIYQIFERLNSGGTQLTAHEIRVALYAGPFIDFLTELNEVKSWRILYGAPSPRIRDQEIILRFIALYLSAGSYHTPLKKFLNEFVGAHRELDGLPVDTLRERFVQATEFLLEGIGPASLRISTSQINVALTEALLVGIARRLDSPGRPDPSRLQSILDSLLKDESFRDSISLATANDEKVRTRLSRSTEAFTNI